VGPFRFKRRVVFAVDVLLENEDSLSALRVAEILKSHAESVIRSSGAVDQVGAERFPFGAVEWRALGVEPVTADYLKKAS
jgi:hypothetical protein